MILIDKMLFEGSNKYLIGGMIDDWLDKISVG